MAADERFVKVDDKRELVELRLHGNVGGAEHNVQRQRVRLCDIDVGDFRADVMDNRGECQPLQRRLVHGAEIEGEACADALAFLRFLSHVGQLGVDRLEREPEREIVGHGGAVRAGEHHLERLKFPDDIRGCRGGAELLAHVEVDDIEGVVTPALGIVGVTQVLVIHVVDEGGEPVHMH